MKGLFTLLKAELMSSARGKLGALLLKKSFYKLKSELDYNNYGGAVFLGVKKVIVKAHGSAKRVSIENAVLQAVSAAEASLSETIAAELSAIDLEGLEG